MFKESFFTIKKIEKAEEHYLVSIIFDPLHDIFTGHFPERKVVPGVMLMQMVKETAQEILNIKDSLLREAGMKFLNPVLVDESNEMELELRIEKLDNDSCKIRSVGKDREKKSFKIDIILTK